MIRAIGLGLALFVGLDGGGASAMTSDTSMVRCSVVRAGLLPVGLSSVFFCVSDCRVVIEAGCYRDDPGQGAARAASRSIRSPAECAGHFNAWQRDRDRRRR